MIFYLGCIFAGLLFLFIMFDVYFGYKLEQIQDDLILKFENKVQNVQAENRKVYVGGEFFDRLRIPERIIEVEAAAERASKKAEAAEYLAHSAKMGSEKPHRVILTIEESPKVKKPTMTMLKKKHIGKAGRA